MSCSLITAGAHTFLSVLLHVCMIISNLFGKALVSKTVPNVTVLPLEDRVLLVGLDPY